MFFLCSAYYRFYKFLSYCNSTFLLYELYLVCPLYLFQQPRFGQSVRDTNIELSLFVGKASENVWGDYCEADAVCFGM